MNLGDKGSYLFYSNIELVEIKDNTVVMKDSIGETKEVFKSLFKKYFIKNSSETLKEGEE